MGNSRNRLFRLLTGRMFLRTAIQRTCYQFLLRLAKPLTVFFSSLNVSSLIFN